jgi:DNA-binding XRE family transcriptional regulator
MATIEDEVSQGWPPRPARRLRSEELRHVRGVLGLTKSGLATALGVSLRSVEEWEGSRNPAPPYLQLALDRLASLKAAADGERAREIRDGRMVPTPDEAAGILWWNGLSEPERAAWMRRAGDTGVVAYAWAAAKASPGSGGIDGL